MKKISDEVLALLNGSSRQKKVHWNLIVEGTVNKSLCSLDELIVVMNNRLMPFGEISGADHYYWIGTP